MKIVDHEGFKVLSQEVKKAILEMININATKSDVGIDRQWNELAVTSDGRIGLCYYANKWYREGQSRPVETGVIYGYSLDEDEFESSPFKIKWSEISA